MPRADREPLLNVHGGELYQMFYAGSPGSLGGSLVSLGNRRAAVNQEESTGPRKGRTQGRTVGQIANADFDSIGEARPRPIRVSHENSRPFAQLNQPLHHPGPDISRSPCNKISHIVSYRNAHI
jgi:hypothetical protein